MNELLELMRDDIAAAIRAALHRAKEVRDTWRSVGEDSSCVCSQHGDNSIDELGRAIEEMFACVIDRMKRLQDSSEVVVKHGYEIERLEELRKETVELQELKTAAFANWPWSHRPLPPADRGMMQRAREAFKRGEMTDTLDTVITEMRGQQLAK